DANLLRDVVVDSAGTAWFVDETEGLLRIAGDSLVQVVPLPKSAYVSGSLLYDRRGRIWINRTDYLAVLERVQLRVFTPARGEVPSPVSGLYEDHAGDIWALGSHGLSRFDGSRFHTLPERQGVPERAIAGVAEDSDGAWWLATRTGVL